MTSLGLIESVRTTLVDLPLARPHRFRDTTMVTQTVLLVRVRTDDGVVGAGEGAVPGGPWWSGESVETMKLIVDHYLAPLVVGGELSRLPALRARMDRLVAANEFAKCALETALWDAWARILGVPLASLLGGRFRDTIPVTWAIGADDPDVVVEEALAKAESGHASIKLKMGAQPPDADVARLEKIAASLAPKTSVRVDLNGAWDLLTATRLLPRLQDAGVDLVEQPSPAHDVDALERLAALLRIPVMADESLRTDHDALVLAARRAADVFSLKIGKSGGLLAAQRIAAVAHAAGIPCHGGTGIESGLGTLAGAQLMCTLPAVTYGSELFGPLLMADDLLAEPLDYRDGLLHLPDGPGLGIDLDEDRIAHYARGP
ncbi:MAG: chloromuconate cycloisomerase [Streptosporangiales bacterium]|nr:chloromuconate cycloisomerase [Streptosporangiales bacterium]